VVTARSLDPAAVADRAAGAEHRVAVTARSWALATVDAGVLVPGAIQIVDVVGALRVGFKLVVRLAAVIDALRWVWTARLASGDRFSLPPATLTDERPGDGEAPANRVCARIEIRGAKRQID